MALTLLACGKVIEYCSMNNINDDNSNKNKSNKIIGNS